MAARPRARRQTTRKSKSGSGSGPGPGPGPGLDHGTYSNPPPPATTHSCDWLDLQFGSVAGVCDYVGADLEGDNGWATGACNCDGCMCSGWPPTDLQYLHKFALESGFVATEEECFSRNTGSGKVAIQVTDDKWKDQVTVV